MPAELIERARAMFTAYRVALTEIRGDPYPAELPQDPTYLSWTLSALRPAPRARPAGAARGRGRAARLTLVTDLLRTELRAMNVIPSCRRGAHALVEPEDGEEEAGRTPATVALDRAGIAYTLHPYDHDPRAASFGLEAAEALGVDPSRVFKTLVAGSGELVVGVVPVSGQLDLKALARALGGSKAVMAEVSVAERATGYVAGGISPIGQKRRTGPSSTSPRSTTPPSWSRPGAAGSTSRSPRPTWSRSPRRSRARSAGAESCVSRSSAGTRRASRRRRSSC